MSQMRVLRSDQLFIDPDVQLAFALKEARWRKMATNWDENLAGFLIVVPNGKVDQFAICDGRHRFLGGSAKGITSWRCDIHDEVDYNDVSAKAALKLGFDYERRHVGSLEHFIIRVMAKDPVAVEMNAVIERCGFKVATNTGSSESSQRLSCVSALERFYDRLGSDGFRRLLQLNTHWLNTVGANNGDWLGGLAIFIRDGYDELLTPTAMEKLRMIAPNIAIAHARGVLAKQGLSSGGGAGTGGFNALHYEVGRYVRRKSGLRTKPVNRRSEKDWRSSEL